MADSDIVRLTQGQIKMIGDKIKEAQESGGYKTLTSADEDFTIEGQTYINAVALPVGEYQVNNARIFFGYNNTKIEQESTLEAIRTYSGFLNRTTCWLSITGTNEMEEPSAYYEKQFRTITVIPRGELRLNYGNGVIDDANKTKLTDLAVIPVGFRNQEQQYPIVCFTSSGVVYEPVSGEFRLATSSEVEQALYQARLVMRGATSLANGASGRVPQPLIADRGKFLRGDGTWASAQADYEENDPNDSSYIQNRPFYEFERVVEERYEPDYVSWNTTDSLDNFTDAQIVKEYATANNIPTYGQAIFYVAVTGGTGTIQTGFPELGTIATSGDEFYWASQTIYDMDDTGYYLKDFSETSFEDFVSTTTGNTYRISSSTFTCNSSTGTLICLYQGDNDNCVFYLTLTSPSALFMYEGFSPDIIVRTTQSETKLLDSKFVNIDNESIINDSGVLKAVSEGGIKTLTTADYNYPTNSPAQIALWLLPAGVYKVSSDFPNNKLFYNSTRTLTTNPNSLIFIAKARYMGWPERATQILASGLHTFYFYQTNTQTGAEIAHGVIAEPQELLEGADTQDNLTSTSQYAPLSANQGKVLKDLIDSLVIKNAGAPTTSTTGTIGQLIEDTTNGDLYQLKSIDTSVTPNTYNWEQVGGSSVNVVQTTGTSTTDVMSQNAVCSRLYGLNSSGTAYTTNVKIGGSTTQVGQTYGVAIGAGAVATHDNTVAVGAGPSGLHTRTNGAAATAVGSGANAQGASSVAIGFRNNATGNSSIAIGAGASATQTGAIALGQGSSATTAGEMNIGATQTAWGYNSSNYRLLTGVYDPQNDHDAATKGYVDGLVGNVESALNVINNGGSN